MSKPVQEIAKSFSSLLVAALGDLPLHVADVTSQTEDEASDCYILQVTELSNSVVAKLVFTPNEIYYFHDNDSEIFEIRNPTSFDPDALVSRIARKCRSDMRS